MNISGVAAAEKADLHLGYVRLTDSAPLIVARELGYFADCGLDVTLHQEVSWANVRDKLAAGVLDAAQMLAPLPAMTTLGVSGLRVPMLTGLTLSLNGNAITLSAALAETLGSAHGAGGAPDALANVRALKTHLLESRQVLTFGVVHTFSTHAILLRAWLKAGGIDPDREVRTLIVPPSQMIDSLASGVIDGYCVGEPWSSIAVQNGLGHIAAFGNQIWKNAPEKVLSVTDRWHCSHPATHLRLRVALMSAGAWLCDPGHRAAAARMIGGPEYLDLSAARLLPSLTGSMTSTPGAEPVYVEDFHVFGSGHAGLPCRDTARFMIERCAELMGRPVDPGQTVSLVQQTTRPDLYREARRCLEPTYDENAPARRTPLSFALG